jgi:hypothetical protein
MRIAQPYSSNRQAELETARNHEIIRALRVGGIQLTEMQKRSFVQEYIEHGRTALTLMCDLDTVRFNEKHSPAKPKKPSKGEK